MNGGAIERSVTESLASISRSLAKIAADLDELKSAVMRDRRAALQESRAQRRARMPAPSASTDGAVDGKALLEQIRSIRCSSLLA